MLLHASKLQTLIKLKSGQSLPSICKLAHVERQKPTRNTSVLNIKNQLNKRVKCLIIAPNTSEKPQKQKSLSWKHVLHHLKLALNDQMKTTAWKLLGKISYVL